MAKKRARSKPPTRDSATDRELQILDVLWSQGPSTIRDISGFVYPQGTTSEYATVQSLLDRLESKALVARDRGGFAHVFAAAVDRSEFIGRELERMADKVCGGSLTPLLLQLVDSVQLTDDEKGALLRRIDEGDTDEGDTGEGDTDEGDTDEGDGDARDNSGDGRGN